LKINNQPAANATRKTDKDIFDFIKKVFIQGYYFLEEINGGYSNN
jgi:hypothetical protein